MSASARTIAIAVMFGALACGSTGQGGGTPPDGISLWCGPGMYILDAACTPLPPFSDAAFIVDVSDGDDAGAAADATENGDSGIDSGVDVGVEGDADATAIANAPLDGAPVDAGDSG